MNENSGSGMDRQRAETIARHAARSVVGLETPFPSLGRGTCGYSFSCRPGGSGGGGAQVTVKRRTTIEVVDVVFLQ